MEADGDLAELFKAKQNSEISRETYWAYARSIFESLFQFMQFQEVLGNKVDFSDGEIIIDLKCTQSHESRMRMLLDPSDVRSVPFSVLCEGFYEIFQADLLFSLGKESRHFLDIGANMGFYSIGLALENPDLRVETFEPQLGVLRYLTRNIEINHLIDRIGVHNVGLSSESGELTMYVPRFTGSGGGSFSNLHPDEGEAKEVTVPVIPLDHQYNGPVDLIKIDVEGFELNVILGGIMLIEKHKPTIVIELLRKWMKPFGHHPQDVVTILSNLGYQCFAIKTSSLNAIENITDQTNETNFVFIHESRVDHARIIQNLVR